MGKLTFSQFLRDQAAKPPPLVAADLTGKTVMVIGANSGIGFEAALHFARMNPARLILGCRDKCRGEAALKEIREKVKCPTAELWMIDMGSFASVRSFATRFEDGGARLDVVVLNAAVVEPLEYSRTEDGWENTLQINCLSQFLLAVLLLPSMIKSQLEHSSKPRLVFVSSMIHYIAKIHKDTVQTGKVYDHYNQHENCRPNQMDVRYPLSKAFGILFARALSARLGTLSSSPIIVNTVNPGLCKSTINRKSTLLARAVVGLVMLAVGWTAEQGSRQLVYAAMGDAREGKEGEGQPLHGAYVNRSEIVEASDYIVSADGKEAQDVMWGEVVGILEKADPRVQSIVGEYLTPPKS
ncbi:short-chain dehydrogenase [Infundibulicybe gibba]|nr:short-chain dehydrogenase [Infundibulicybe gibba]